MTTRTIIRRNRGRRTPIPAIAIKTINGKSLQGAGNLDLYSISTLSFGAITSIALSATAVHIVPFGGYGGTGLPNRAFDLRMVPMSQDGTISKWFVNMVTAQPVTGSLVLTFVKEGVDTPLVITIPAGSAGGVYSNTTDEVDVIEGDEVSVKASNNASSISGSIVGWNFKIKSLIE